MGAGNKGNLIGGRWVDGVLDLSALLVYSRQGGVGEQAPIETERIAITADEHAANRAGG